MTPMSPTFIYSALAPNISAWFYVLGGIITVPASYSLIRKTLSGSWSKSFIIPSLLFSAAIWLINVLMHINLTKHTEARCRRTNPIVKKYTSSIILLVSGPPGWKCPDIIKQVQNTTASKVKAISQLGWKLPNAHVVRLNMALMLELYFS